MHQVSIHKMRKGDWLAKKFRSVIRKKFFHGSVYSTCPIKFKIRQSQVIRCSVRIWSLAMFIFARYPKIRLACSRWPMHGAAQKANSVTTAVMISKQPIVTIHCSALIRDWYNLIFSASKKSVVSILGWSPFLRGAPTLVFGPVPKCCL